MRALREPASCFRPEMSLSADEVSRRTLHGKSRFPNGSPDILKMRFLDGRINSDVQLDNIMLVPDSAMVDGERTKVLDFGIAKLQKRNSSLASTRQDLLMGTPGYMSPEQCRGAAGVDDRSDVYSLGVVLYRLLAGRMPFVASGPGEIMAMHIYEEPPPLKLFGEWVPDEVAAFTHRLLAKDKDARPAMTEVVVEIERLLVEIPDAKPVVSVMAAALEDSGQLAVSSAVSSMDGDSARDSDSADSDSVMPTVDAGSFEERPAKSAEAMARRNLTPSTLAGQQRTLGPPRQLRTVALLAGAALAVVGAGGLLWQRHREAGHRAAALSGGPDPGAAPTPAVVKPPVPTAPKIVRWSVYTEPPGATVVRVSDGSVLGQTPWQSEHEAASGTEELRLRLAGHVERLIRLERGSDAARRDVLEPIATPTEPPDASGKPKRDSTRKKPRNVAIEFED
jgi:hypothetical protein